MAKFLLTLVAVYVLMCVAAFLFQRKLIFLPSRQPCPDPVEMGIEAEKITIPLPNGHRLIGWWAAQGDSPYTLIWCHGNAGCLNYRADEFRRFQKAGFKVLLFDYRGYGESTGSPTADGIRADALTVHDFLVSKGIPAATLVPYGRSIGSGAATFLAAEREVAGLILVQPLTSLREMAQKAYPFLPVGWLLREQLDNTAALQRFGGPLLILHGDADDIVPYEMGRRLFDGAGSHNKQFETLEGGDHNNIGITHSQQMITAIQRWLSALEK